MEAISRPRDRSQVAPAFLAAGLVSIVQSALPSAGAVHRRRPRRGSGSDSSPIAILGRFLPWQRWPGHRDAPAARSASIRGRDGPRSAASTISYGCYFLVVFVWIGVTQPRHPQRSHPAGRRDLPDPDRYRAARGACAHVRVRGPRDVRLVGESRGGCPSTCDEPTALETRRPVGHARVSEGRRPTRVVDRGGTRLPLWRRMLATSCCAPPRRVVLLPATSSRDRSSRGCSARSPGGEGRRRRMSRADVVDGARGDAQRRGPSPSSDDDRFAVRAGDAGTTDGCTLVLVPLRGRGTCRGVLSRGYRSRGRRPWIGFDRGHGDELRDAAGSCRSASRSRRS